MMFTGGLCPSCLTAAVDMRTALYNVAMVLEAKKARQAKTAAAV